jgi:hypothetical protein
MGLFWLVMTGLGMVHLALPRARLTEKAGLAFPISCGLHGAIYYVLVQSRGSSIWWSIIILSPFLASTLKANVKPDFPVRFHLKPLDAFALVFALLAFTQVWIHLLVTPIREWDALAMWVFKARAIATDGRITSAFVNWLAAQGRHPAYPWNVPMMQVWLSGIAGGFSETLSKWMYALFFTSLLLILYSIARLKWQRTGSLIFVAAYLSIPVAVEAAGFREADIVLETLIAAIIFLALRRQILPERGAIALVAVLVFLCCWTKIEGVAFSALVFLPYLFLALLSSPNRAENTRLFAGAAAGLAAGFLAFWISKSIFGASTIFASGIPIFGPREWMHRTVFVLKTTLAEMLQIQRWNLTWFAAGGMLWAGRDRFHLKFLLLVHLALYLVVYLLTPLPLEWHMTTSLARVLLHTLPTCFALCVFSFDTKSQRGKAEIQ